LVELLKKGKAGKVLEPRLPKVYQKIPQPLVLQTVGGFPVLEVSTGCLPIQLFYVKTGCFSDFLPAFKTSKVTQEA